MSAQIGGTVAWLRTEDRGQVRWIVLDRPERKNAVPPEGWEELRAAFEEFETSSQRALVIIGAGGDFCSGADLDPSAGVALSSAAGRHARMKTVGATALTLHRLSKPTVAAVDGVAVGAGMNLALGCDVVVASTRARFAELFSRRGLVIDFGGTWLLPRIVGLQRAKLLALSGRTIEAAEAQAWGLVLEVVEPDHLEATAQQRAEEFLLAAPLAQMFAKQALDRSSELSFEEALGWEGQSQAIALATEDAAEGIAAFMEKRPPVWKGR